MEPTQDAVNNQPVSEEAEIAQVNEAAAAELKAPSEQASKTDSSTVSGTDVTAKAIPSNTVAKVEPEFDVRKSYEELRKDYTRKTQALSSFEKAQATMTAQLKEMQAKLEQATKKPVDLERFFTDLKAQGPDAILPYFKPELEKLQASYDEKLAVREKEAGALRIELSLVNRRMDAKNYPDFVTLEPKMRDMLESGTAPVDFSKPMDQVIDALYNLVRSQNSVEAVKQAEKSGYVKAQAELAKEAKTAVATGGKGTSTTPGDMWKMPIDKLEALVTQMHGVADRD